jgi:hypothetical protein
MAKDYNKVRKDSNHKEIIEAARSFGAYIVDCAALKNAFDVLIAFKGKLYVVEIKDGSKPPSKRLLTQGELECKKNFELQGINYNVVESVEDLAKLLLLKF